MMKSLSYGLTVFICVTFAACTTVPERKADAAKERIVIQVSDDNPRTWGQALNVAGNLQEAYGAGNAQIELVAFGMGINMLKAEALVASRVRDAAAAGVKVYACENSMGRFKLKRADMLEKVTYVDAGVQHIIARNKEGWVNIRP